MLISSDFRSDYLFKKILINILKVDISQYFKTKVLFVSSNDNNELILNKNFL